MCGSGIKTRMLDCVRSDGKSVDMKFCEAVSSSQPSCASLAPFLLNVLIISLCKTLRRPRVPIRPGATGNILARRLCRRSGLPPFIHPYWLRCCSDGGCNCSLQAAAQPYPQLFNPLTLRHCLAPSPLLPPAVFHQSRDFWELRQRLAVANSPAATRLAVVCCQ